MFRTATAGLCFFAAFSAAAAEQSAAPSGQELLATLKGAAPDAVLNGATLVDMSADGKMTVVRPGTNEWTCMESPGGAMCADAAGMEWGKAWQEKAAPPQKLGFIYMLRGDNGGSNTDPYATKETPDNNWIQTGPHVMIVGADAKTMLQTYPRQAKPDPSKPYVMWPGTPYEHLMLPVK